MTLKEGRVTIPTNLDVVPETIELMKRWGADAIRDCDGTEFTEELVRTVYEVENQIFINPISGCPMVTFLSPLPNGSPAVSFDPAAKPPSLSPKERSLFP